MSSLLPAPGTAHVVVVGDVIVDRATEGTALGLSSETPTLVARHRSDSTTIGGAGLVVRNLLELGANVTFITLAGDDDGGRLVRSFTHPRLTTHTVGDAARRTTVKHRYWVDGYKLLQFDTLDGRPPDAGDEARIDSLASSALATADALVLCDNRHGLLAASLATRLLAAARAAGRPSWVDSQVSQSASNHAQYSGADGLCLNLREARAVDPSFSPGVDPACFARLRAVLGGGTLVVKLGADGAIAAAGDRVHVSAAQPVVAVDPCGAGDAFLAALVLVAKEGLDRALHVANAWAGLSTTRRGPNPPLVAELEAALAARSAS